ncbi:MAG: hypothetical protein ACKVT0_11885 [Planctomycetaceae bacterium]
MQSSPIKLFLLESPNVYWPLAMNNEYAAAFQRSLYANCSHVKRLTKSFDFHTKELGTYCPYNFEGHTLIPIIRRDLMDVLRLRPGKRYIFGRIFTPEGKLLTDRKAVYPLQQVQLRGKEVIEPYFCKTCRQFIFMPHKPLYVLSRDVPRTSIAFDDGATMIITEEVLDRIRAAEIKQLTIKELPIRDDPLDNLPADLSTLTPEMLKSLQRKGLVPKNRLVKRSARL